MQDILIKMSLLWPYKVLNIKNIGTCYIVKFDFNYVNASFIPNRSYLSLSRPLKQ